MGDPNNYDAIDEIPNLIWIDCGHGNGICVPRGEEMINSEGFGIWESIGFSFFALWPRRCRNGKVRWFTWLQKHQDGTFTKCNLNYRG